MAVKNLSTRVNICGRSARCRGGHSAVEQAAYIARQTMYCEYDGMTYYPKYSEDLVHAEVMLPDNAPDRYKDPSVLWNEVEMVEKGGHAQLARTYRVSLPNEWSYELATEVMKDYCQRNFVDRGMCAQFAIHDSENKESGQRNLHCHIMLTTRGIDENGQWMSKQKKVYLRDENGERIPLIDKNTGQQKVDKRNRKQWKCASVPTNDWNSKENAKLWRKDLADTINNVNSKLGMTENFWEYRSFKEQGLDIVPQIHLGEKASAMERAGIRTSRGDINRDISAHNAILLKAKAVVDQAKKELAEVKSIPVKVFNTLKNEIIDMIQEVAKRKRNRLSLPIVGNKYLSMISDRAVLQEKERMEKFVIDNGFQSFVDLNAFKKEQEEKYEELYCMRSEKRERINYLEKLLKAYDDYEPYIKYNKELFELKGFARKKYKRNHLPELTSYETHREYLKKMIVEEDKRIIPKAWRKELEKLTDEYEQTQRPTTVVVTKLAKVEVLMHNKKELERMLENEKNQRTREQIREVKTRKVDMEL